MTGKRARWRPWVKCGRTMGKVCLEAGEWHVPPIFTCLTVQPAQVQYLPWARCGLRGQHANTFVFPHTLLPFPFPTSSSEYQPLPQAPISLLALILHRWVCLILHYRKGELPHFIHGQCFHCYLDSVLSLNILSNLMCLLNVRVYIPTGYSSWMCITHFELSGITFIGSCHHKLCLTLTPRHTQGQQLCALETLVPYINLTSSPCL